MTSYNYYKTIQHSKQVHTFFLNCSLSKFILHLILGKMKFDSLVLLILNCLLGYMMNDHIVLTILRKVNWFSAITPWRWFSLESCSFWDTLYWYDKVLASSGVFWGDSGMNSEGNFNVYLFPWKVFRLKIVEALLFLSTSLSVSFVSRANIYNSC